MAKKGILPFEFDSRMVEWNLKHNVITREQLKTYLQSLPDESSNAEAIEIEDDDTGAGHYENGLSSEA